MHTQVKCTHVFSHSLCLCARLFPSACFVRSFFFISIWEQIFGQKHQQNYGGNEGCQELVARKQLADFAGREAVRSAVNNDLPILTCHTKINSFIGPNWGLLVPFRAENF